MRSTQYKMRIVTMLFIFLITTANAQILKEVTAIARKYFQTNFVQIFLDVDRNHTNRLLLPEKTQLFMDVIPELMDEQTWSFQMINDRAPKIPERFQTKNSKVENILVLMECMQHLDHLLALIKQQRIVNYKTMTLIVCRCTNVKPIFVKFWKEVRAFRLAVVSITDQIEYFTWSPYKSEEILPTNPNDIFSMTIPKNFNGFPITAGIDFMDPYVLAGLTGLEIEIFKMIAKSFNFKGVIVTAPKGVNSRIVYQGNTTNGLFGMLYRNEIDVAFGGMMRNPDRYSASEVVYPHTEDRLLWCYPRPITSISWTSLYRAFSITSWGLIGSLIMLNASVIFLLGRETRETVYAQFSNCLLTVWGVTLDAGFPVRPKSDLFRIFIIIAFFYVIIISCLYKSCLVTFLTTPVAGRSLDSVVDALDRGFNLLMQTSAKQSQSPDDPYWGKILRPGRFFYNQNSEENLAVVAYNKTSIYLTIFYTTESQQSSKFLDSEGRPLISYFKETFNTFSTCMFLSPGHPLEGIFNTKTMQLIESGIVSFSLHRILEEAKRKTMQERIQLGTVVSQIGPQPLSINQLFIVFVGISTMLSICLVIFIGEVMSQAYVKRFKKT